MALIGASFRIFKGSLAPTWNVVCPNDLGKAITGCTTHYHQNVSLTWTLKLWADTSQRNQTSNCSEPVERGFTNNRKGLHTSVRLRTGVRRLQELRRRGRVPEL